MTGKMLTCSQCKVAKPESDFTVCRRNKSGRENRCRNCLYAMLRERFDKYPEHVREIKRASDRRRRKLPGFKRKAKNQNLRSKYGLTIEQYELMLAERDGKCDICGRKPDYDLHVDHDHESERLGCIVVRGLLCAACNSLLGKVREDDGLIQAVRNYLIKHGSLKNSNFGDKPWLCFDGLP